MEIKDFVQTPSVLQIFVDEAILYIADQVFILEQYKFCTRSSIISVFSNQFEDPVLDVSEIKRDPLFKEIEDRFHVLLRADGKTVYVYYPAFATINKDAIELALGKFIVKYAILTPFNFGLLEGDPECTRFNHKIMFKRILIEAIKMHATDIHFCVEHPSPDEVNYPIKCRCNSDLVKMDLFNLTADLNRSIISSLVENKTNANSLDLITPAGVTALANDPLGDGNLELRVSANKVLDGWHCVIRIQQKATFTFTLDSLGFHERVVDAMKEMLTKTSGILLYVGAIRTGKNTSAFALANELVKQPLKIVSYEYPIEAYMPFTQIDYGGDTEILLNAVRLAKKQDVNVAFINEIPNKEVAFAVQDLVNSSIFVITTMHVDRIWHLPYKLREYYGDEYKNIISQLNGVFAQKMFKVPCKNCQNEKLVSDLEPRFAEFLRKRGAVSLKVSEGCSQCNNTGYVFGANQPYVEFLIFNDEIKEKLLACDQPYEMERVLKDEVFKRDSSFETFMSEAVIKGDLSPDALYKIL